MKNKVVSIILLFFMLLSVFVSGGCDIIDQGSEDDFVYDAENIQANLDRLTASGYKITLRYLSVDESENQTESGSGGFTIAANGEMWFCEQNDDESKSTVIMDFSDDTEFVTYTKNGTEEKWQKTVNSYNYFGDKETVKSLYMDTYIMMFTSYGVMATDFKNKGPVTVAGRACTKYESSISTFGASYSNEYCIDNETGLCLKNVVAVGSVTEGSASVSYECTEFKVGYRITVPPESECIGDDQY